MPGITAYARIAGLLLLATAAVGLAGWGFDTASVFYHAGVGLLFLFVGFCGLESITVRRMVGGLGVLLASVSGVAILMTWLLPTRYLHGPVEIGGLGVGVGSILAARYLPDRRGLKRGRRVS